MNSYRLDPKGLRACNLLPCGRSAPNVRAVVVAALVAIHCAVRREVPCLAPGHAMRAPNLRASGRQSRDVLRAIAISQTCLQDLAFRFLTLSFSFVGRLSGGRHDLDHSGLIPVARLAVEHVHILEIISAQILRARGAQDHVRLALEVLHGARLLNLPAAEIDMPHRGFGRDLAAMGAHQRGDVGVWSQRLRCRRAIECRTLAARDVPGARAFLPLDFDPREDDFSANGSATLILAYDLHFFDYLLIVFTLTDTNNISIRYANFQVVKTPVNLTFCPAPAWFAGYLLSQGAKFLGYAEIGIRDDKEMTLLISSQQAIRIFLRAASAAAAAA